jgi:hypothetical protein
MHNPCQIVHMAKKNWAISAATTALTMTPNGRRYGRLANRVVALMTEGFAKENQGKKNHYWKEEPLLECLLVLKCHLQKKETDTCVRCALYAIVQLETPRLRT